MLYTVDRWGGLAQGQVLALSPATINPASFQAHMTELFPDGLSRHGHQYLANANQGGLNPTLELVVEYVRRAAYPERASRFQSLFVCETLDDARRFRADFSTASPGAQIWEVEGTAPGFRADMAWLTVHSSILGASYCAHRYWEGQPLDSTLVPNGQSLWEVLLPLPVTVGAQVE